MCMRVESAVNLLIICATGRLEVAIELGDGSLELHDLLLLKLIDALRSGELLSDLTNFCLSLALSRLFFALKLNVRLEH